MQNLKYGYAVVPYSFTEDYQVALKAAFRYFERDMSYKTTHIVEDVIEYNYNRLFHKEVFVIRNQKIPSELGPCISYIHKVHQFGMQCVKIIAEQLQLDFNIFSELFQSEILPIETKSSSVLRLFRYEQLAEADDGYLSCPAHEDLGVITIIPRSDVAGLEIYDYASDKGWIDIEAQMRSDEALILVGETLALLSNNYYLPATHRVRQGLQSRISLVYHLHADKNFVLDSNKFESLVTGKFSRPFNIKFKEFIENARRARTSINGSY